MIDSNRSLPNSQSQELMFSRKDVVPTLCLVVLAFAISWLSLGDDRTTTKGWFPAWFEQFRSFESGTFPYSPFPPTTILVEGGIPSLFSDANLGEDLWHATVLALLGPVLYIGFRQLTGSLISFGSAAIWTCLQGNSGGNMIGGYLETANLFVATCCTLLLWSDRDRPRQERSCLYAAGVCAAFAVGLKQSFLPFVIAVAVYLFLERDRSSFGSRRPASRRGLFFAFGCLAGLSIQVFLWWISFPGLNLQVGLSRFFSGGGKSDSIVALLSSAANSLTPLNSVAGFAIIATIGLAIRDMSSSADSELATLIGLGLAVGASALFLWTIPVNAEQGAVRLAIFVWVVLVLWLAKRGCLSEARIALATLLTSSTFVFMLAFRELVVPVRQSFLITMRGLSAAPVQLAGSVSMFLAVIGLLSALINIQIGASRSRWAVRCIAVSSGVSMLFQLPLGGVLLNGHIFGFAIIALFGAVASQSFLLVQTVVRGVVFMLALSGVAQETVHPYVWYGVVGSNDLARVDESGVFYARGSTESENRFEHALLSNQLASLEVGSEVLVGVRNSGLIVGHENLELTQRCLVMWFDICPEEVAEEVLKSALGGDFDFALWSPENPDVLFANTLMWRDRGSQIGNPPPTAVAQLQSWLLTLVEAEPRRLIHVAWPDREYGTETFLVDLREVGVGSAT